MDTHPEKIPALSPQPFHISHFAYDYYLVPQEIYTPALPSTDSLEERGATQHSIIPVFQHSPKPGVILLHSDSWPLSLHPHRLPEALVLLLYPQSYPMPYALCLFY